VPDAGKWYPLVPGEGPKGAATASGCLERSGKVDESTGRRGLKACARRPESDAPKKLGGHVALGTNSGACVFKARGGAWPSSGSPEHADALVPAQGRGSFEPGLVKESSKQAGFAACGAGGPRKPLLRRSSSMLLVAEGRGEAVGRVRRSISAAMELELNGRPFLQAGTASFAAARRSRKATPSYPASLQHVRTSVPQVLR